MLLHGRPAANKDEIAGEEEPRKQATPTKETITLSLGSVSSLQLQVRSHALFEFK